MGAHLAVVAVSVTTFAATNLDDLFLLTVLFARRVSPRKIVVGQYLGFAAIVAASGALVWAAGHAIPGAWLRWLGILPLGIGIKELIQIHKVKSTRNREGDSSLGVLSIAAVTFANGSDNIGVYVPFLLGGRSHLWLILATYALLVLVWCAAGRWFGSHPIVLKVLDRWGHWIVPFVLIGLGGYILLFLSPQ